METKNIITILIADDQPIARAGIQQLLSKAKDFEIVGEARDGFETLKRVSQLRPRVLLLDIKMPGPRSFEIEKWIRENIPETVTLVLTSHDHDAYLASMIDAGAVGYLTKEESANRLINAIRQAAIGIIYFNEEQIDRMQRWKHEVKEKWEKLSIREREVLRILKLGKDNKTIAESLSVSIKTVEFHMTNILKKLTLNSRDEAIVWMHENSVGDLDIS